MRKLFVLPALMALAVANAHAQADPFAGQEVVPHVLVEKKSDFIVFLDDVNAFLGKYVVNGLANYEGIKKDYDTIKKLINFIETINMEQLEVQSRKVFLINTYNLLVINSVVESYPITSPQSIPGFFDKKKHLVGGKKLTLDEVEKKELFAISQDPRLHFALVCAAKGCPPIASAAYYPNTLEKQVEEQTKKALNDNNFLFTNDNKQKIYLSPIFDWYKNDFKPSVTEFINEHRSQKLPEGYEIVYYTYDWKLNDFSVFSSQDSKFAITPMSVTEFNKEIEKENELFVVDARSAAEYEVGHLQSARRVGFDDFSVERVWMIPHNKAVAVYAASNENSEKVGKYLQEMGFERVYTLGNIVDLVNQDVKLVDKSDAETTNVHVGDKANLKNLKKGKGVSF